MELISEAAMGRLFLGFLALGFVALTVWGFLIRAAALHVMRAHPDWAATLAARSRRKMVRLAVVSELQNVLFQDEEIPESVREDPRFARFLEREKRVRNIFLPLALAAFAVYILAFALT